VHRVRLWPDSARALGAEAAPGGNAKPTIDDLGAQSREPAEKPLVACYVLHPAAAGDKAARRRLSDVHAAVACVSFSKLGGLGGGRLGIEVLERATRLAQTVPVYVAGVPRDLDRLDRVASEVVSWHQSTTPNVASAR